MNYAENITENIFRFGNVSSRFINGVRRAALDGGGKYRGRLGRIFYNLLVIEE